MRTDTYPRPETHLKQTETHLKQAETHLKQAETHLKKTETHLNIINKKKREDALLNHSIWGNHLQDSLYDSHINRRPDNRNQPNHKAARQFKEHRCNFSPF